MAPGGQKKQQVKKLQADLANLKARLAATRLERDLMKVVSDELHSKVLDLETEMSSRVAGTPDAGPRIMPAEREASAGELAEAQARAERLAERVAELRLQLSVFAPDSKEAASRAGETLDRARQASERIQTLERQLVTARAREDNLVSQGVRNESAIADLEARVLELSGLEVHSAEAEIARVDAEEALMEMQGELLMLRVEVERLRKDRDEARQRAEAERALAAADRLRADEAQRLAGDVGARSGDMEAALRRIAALEADLAEERAHFQDQEPAVAVNGSQMADLLVERDDLQVTLSAAQTRLSALEEVAAHAAVLESEMSDARARMPEMRIGAEAAARRAAELSEALHKVESERDALRSALEGRLRDMNDLRDRVNELEATSSQPTENQDPAQPAPSDEQAAEISIDAPALSQVAVSDAQEELRQSGPGLASIWLSDGVDGSVDALVDLSETEPGPDVDPATSGAEGSAAESDMASAGTEARGSWLRRRGRSAKKQPPEDPTSWT
jgi:chromosome segregation ATPase